MGTIKRTIKYKEARIPHAPLRKIFFINAVKPFMGVNEVSLKYWDNYVGYG